MSSNNGKFRNNFFTEINGATISGPESASVTDILVQFMLTQWQKGVAHLLQQNGKDIEMTRGI